VIALLQLAGRHEARVVREHPGFLVELADVDGGRADRAGDHRQLCGVIGGIGEGDGLGHG
jgi:hypothetical protein